MYLSSNLNGLGKVKLSADQKAAVAASKAAAKTAKAAAATATKIAKVDAGAAKAVAKQVAKQAKYATKTATYNQQAYDAGIPAMIDPPVSSAPKSDPSITYPGVAPTSPSVAPPPAAESTALMVPAGASNFGPPPSSFGPSNFGPTEPAVTDAAPAASNNAMPIMLGVGALALILMMKKKK